MPKDGKDPKHNQDPGGIYMDVDRGLETKQVVAAMDLKTGNGHEDN
jgi:hypothetical protein